MRQNMLYEEPFVAVFPSLVREMGGDVTAAAVMQHIFFRSSARETFEDGEGIRWWPVSLGEIADEIGISAKQAQRAVGKLRDAGHLAIQKLGGTDRRNFYSVPSMRPYGLMEGPHTGSSKDPIRADVPIYQRSKREEEDLRKAHEPDPFDAFWEIYPRREAKASARKAWQKALGRADPGQILAGAERYRDDPNREPKFTAHPASWLNGDRWLDDPLPTSRAISGTEMYFDLISEMEGPRALG
jgi:hypothetical protein